MERRAFLSAIFVLTGLSFGCFLQPRAHVPDADTGRVISAAQIERSGAETVWDALRYNVRYTMFDQDGHGSPERVRRRGASSIALFESMLILIDDVRVLDLVVLEQMPARDVDHIRVLSGVEATTHYGTNAGDGAILIYTRGG